MRHIEEIFTDKDLSFLDKEYDDFVKKKKKYLETRTTDDYLKLTFVFAAIDASLKMQLSNGYLSLNELWDIRASLREGLQRLILKAKKKTRLKYLVLKEIVFCLASKYIFCYSDFRGCWLAFFAPCLVPYVQEHNSCA